eukprot:763808-Hanusia_phi.AAC.1
MSWSKVGEQKGEEMRGEEERRGEERRGGKDLELEGLVLLLQLRESARVSDAVPLLARLPLHRCRRILRGLQLLPQLPFLPGGSLELVPIRMSEGEEGEREEGRRERGRRERGRREGGG